MSRTSQPALRPVPGLRALRLDAALSQRDLAARAGITQATVVRLERGLPARPSTIRKLADVLGVAPIILMRDHPHDTESPS
jgi:transcriptional regulator with XRE-family HTH domain